MTASPADLLKQAHAIAIVGYSANVARPSHDVARFLQSRGFRIIPVNPGLAGQIELGETVYASLRDIPEPIDMVDIFRSPEHVPPIVADAIAIGARTVWMQIGVINHDAAHMANAAGLNVVMNRCTKIEFG